MKRRTLRTNPALPTTKKSKERQARFENMDAEERTQDTQLLTWDGILAAMTFSIPFVVAISINLQTSLAITAVLAAVLLPASLLCYVLREQLRLPPWIVAPMCALVASGITAFAAVYIRSNYAQVNDALGMYLYLVAAYPVVGAVFYGRRRGTLKGTVVRALRNILYFGFFTGSAGIVRELLGYGRFAGIELDFGFKLEAAKAPFFGFIVFAFILAAVAMVYRVVSGRLMAAGTQDDEEYSEIDSGQQPAQAATQAATQADAKEAADDD